MADKINDGGSAFSQMARRGFMHEDGTITPIGDGMSLRDYFAAAALQGIIAHPDEPASPQDEFVDLARDLAAAAYVYADAMLRAREHKP